MKRYNECCYNGRCDYVQEVAPELNTIGADAFEAEEPWFWFHMLVGISMCGSLYALYMLIDTVAHLRNVVSNGF